MGTWRVRGYPVRRGDLSAARGSIVVLRDPGGSPGVRGALADGAPGAASARRPPWRVGAAPGGRRRGRDHGAHALGFLAAIHEFAGPDATVAVVEPAAPAALTTFDKRAEHFELALHEEP